MITKFASLGVPEQVVMDNRPAFKSVEFKQFHEKNGIHHSITSLYHPPSNGLAERAVQAVKSGLKKIRDGDLETHLLILVPYDPSCHHRSVTHIVLVTVYTHPWTNLNLN